MSDITSKFSAIGHDPRFRTGKRIERKVRVDKRFKGMFNQSKFKLKCAIDMRGRPCHSTTTENLRKYYDLSSSNTDDDGGADDDDSGAEDGNGATAEESDSLEEQKEVRQGKIKIYAKDSKPTKKKGNRTTEIQLSKKEVSTRFSTNFDKSLKERKLKAEKLSNVSVESEESTGNSCSDKSGSDTDEEQATAEYIARGLTTLTDSSSSEDSSEEFEHTMEEIEHEWGQLDKEAKAVASPTSRLAVCNMDWDHIKAQDIMILFNSFRPPGGAVLSVVIYPSEFGLDRMRQEDVDGPAEIVADDNCPQVEGGDYQLEKLRRYQLNRMKYYYAIATFDSCETANAIYEECDGIMYESSGNRLDLRFVPDDMHFSQTPSSRAESLPEPSTYQPTIFTSTALHQSQVKCTWDQTDADRVSVTKKKFSAAELENLDIAAYVASGDDDSGSAEDPYDGFLDMSDFRKPKESLLPSSVPEELSVEEKKKLLLGNDGEESDDVDMEISWQPALIAKAEKHVGQRSLGVWEKYLEKRQEKKRARRKFLRRKGMKSDESDVSSEVPSDVEPSDSLFNNAPLSTEKTGVSAKQKRGKTEMKKREEQDSNLELLLMDNNDHLNHFSLQTIIENEKPMTKRRRVKLKKGGNFNQDTFNVDVKDDRFAALYNNPAFNIDPTAPEFKNTVATKALIAEKLKTRETANGSTAHGRWEESLQRPRRSENDLKCLVKSVKSKSANFKRKK